MPRRSPSGWKTEIATPHPERRDLIPLVVTGLKDYRWPKLEEKLEFRDPVTWFQHRVTPTDGAQVFVADDGSFGTVFLVAGSGNGGHRIFSASSGVPFEVPPKLAFTAGESALMIDGMTLSSPPFQGAVWKRTAGDSLATAWNVPGGRMGFRISPNEDSADLQVWFRNDEAEPVSAQFDLVLENARAAGFTSVLGVQDYLLLKSVLGDLLTIAWPPVLESSFDVEGDDLRAVASVRLPRCPPGRRAHAYGTLYKTTIDVGDLFDRIEREQTPVIDAP